jgi:Beta-lactamase enzyme family
MSGRRHRLTLAPAAAIIVAISMGTTLGLGATPASASVAHPLTTKAICVSAKHPKLAARISAGIAAALRGRQSVVGLAAADADLGLSCKLESSWHFDAASVIKATIISALLLKEDGPSHLTKEQRSLAWEMITESDNDAATALWDEIGISGMQRFLDLAKMTHTRLATAWGLSELTAQDEVTLLKLLTTKGTVLSTASRRYALWLMAHVVPSERWGTPAGAPSDVTVHVKNGWLPYPTGSDWHINSIGAFTGKKISYQIAILTEDNPSMDYGIATIQAAATVINRELAPYK